MNFSWFFSLTPQLTNLTHTEPSIGSKINLSFKLEPTIHTHSHINKLVKNAIKKITDISIVLGEQDHEEGVCVDSTLNDGELNVKSKHKKY